MTRTLITHPSPNLLRHQARMHLSRGATLTVVPNLAAGRSLRQLTRQALPTVTFAQLARRQLAQAGWVPLSPAEREARLQALLTRLNLEYFSAILDRPGTVSALSDVIRALLRSDASRLPPGRSARERDLVRLHRAWVLELLRDAAFDAAIPEFFASRVALTPQPVTVSGFAYLDAAQIALLDRLAADGSVMFLPAAGPDGLSEAQRTARALRGRGWVIEEAPGDPFERDPRLARTGDRAARSVLPAAAGPAAGVPVLVLGSVVEETREVLRQVQAAHVEDGVPWHDLAIVVRDEAAYLPPLLETAQRYGVPLLSQARAPLLATPLGSLLRAWADAGLEGWAFHRTLDVLTHPLASLPVDVEAARRRFRRRSPGGLGAWDGAALAFLDWPAQDTGAGYLQHLTRGLGQLGVLDRQRHDAGLGVALAALQPALQPLADGTRGPRAEFLQALKAALAAASVPVLPGKGGVRVATPLGTLGRSFQAVWVLGLSTGLFPRPVADPPLLDAHLRAAWSETGVYLPGAAESQAIEQALFFHALACARDRLTLTRPEVVSGGQRVPASPFLRPFPAGVTPEGLQAASAREARVLQARTGTLEDESVDEQARREDRRERGLEDGPRFPGVVDPDRWTWSASQLHTFGACRYRWFAGKVMRLEAPDEPQRGLDSLGRGSLYHLALQKLLAPHLGAPTPGADELAGGVAAALDEAAAALTAAGEIELGPLWPAERRDHVRALQQAVLTPEFLPAGHTVEALEQRLEGAVTVDGQAWAFQGYADRVDTGPGGQRAVTDYKLSTYISRVRDGAGDLTTEVQLPLYLALTGAAVGRYFSLNHAKDLLRTGPGDLSSPVPWAEKQQALTAFLSGMRADVIAGDFRARPDRAMTACGLCDLQPVCRFQAFSVGESA